MENISVNITDKSAEALDAFRNQIDLGLQAIGFTAEGYAKDDCPVDTGRLRNSITNAVDGNDVYIGTNVEYAPAVEFRDIDHKVGEAHFLRDAATTHNDEYEKIMVASLTS